MSSWKPREAAGVHHKKPIIVHFVPSWKSISEGYVVYMFIYIYDDMIIYDSIWLYMIIYDYIWLYMTI